MLSVQDKSSLTAFCDRVSKLEGVYVVAERGRNAARARQIWRLDDIEGTGTFDVGDLFRDVEGRLLTDPSEEPTWVKCLRLNSGERMDSCKIEPADAREGSSELENASAVGHLSVALSSTVRELLGSTERQLADARDELRVCRQEVREMTTLLAEYRILEAVGMRHDDLLSEDGGGEMGAAWAFLTPILQSVAARLTAPRPPRLTGPTNTDTDTDTDSEAAEPEAVEIDCSEWGDVDADALVRVLAAMATQRPDLVTPERIDLLMASPLAALIGAHLMGGGAS